MREKAWRSLCLCGSTPFYGLGFLLLLTLVNCQLDSASHHFRLYFPLPNAFRPVLKPRPTNCPHTRLLIRRLKAYWDLLVFRRLKLEPILKCVPANHFPLLIFFYFPILFNSLWCASIGQAAFEPPLL